MLGRFGGRHAQMITLEMARARWAHEAERLRYSRDLSDRERDLLRPAVRQYCVRNAARRRSILALVELALVTSAGAACLLAPVAVVGPAAVRVLDPAGLLTASAGYLAVFGTMSTLYLLPFSKPRPMQLGLLATLACLLVFTLATVVTADPQPALRYAAAAGGLAVLTVTAARFGLIFLGTYVWVPIKYRGVATMSPAWLAATLLWLLTRTLEEAGGRWRRPADRRDLVIETASIYWVEVLPRAMWWAGYRGSLHAEIRRHAGHLAGLVEAVAWRLTNCTNPSCVATLRRELASTAVALAAGDWAPALGKDPPAPRSHWLAITRRVAAAALLVAAALLLPYLPGVIPTGPALTSLQVALIVTAALSLTPVDPAARDRVLSAFGDSRHRD